MGRKILRVFLVGMLFFPLYSCSQNKNEHFELENTPWGMTMEETMEAYQVERDDLDDIQEGTYLEDGHCSLSNNLSENAIRPFTVGRKNWLFSASPKGAASNAIVYTMVEMAKANDLNTYKYLTYLLSQRPDAKMSDEQLEQLAPWSETAKANCQN